MLRLKAVEE